METLTENNYLIKLLESINSDQIFGFIFHKNEILEHYKNTWKKFLLSNNNQLHILNKLSIITQNLPLCDSYIDDLRWNDVFTTTYNTDKLGASIIPSLKTTIPSKTIILCQAPLYDSIYSFLDMQIKRNIKTFIILEKEADIHYDSKIYMKKYYRYWSSKEYGSKKFGNMIVTTKEITRIGSINLIDISILNFDTGYTHDAKIIHYLDWIDKNAINISELSYLVNFVNKYSENEIELLIHCSAGIGRSGTLCLALIINNFTKEELKSITINELVLFIKICRPLTIQTESQYQLLVDYAHSLNQ